VKRNIYFVKGAIVLFIAMVMVLSSVAIAKTKVRDNQIEKITTNIGKAFGVLGPVVWDNGMEYTGLGAAQKDDQYPFYAECADDFMFEEATEVCDVHWVGGYWNEPDLYNKVHWPWEITFYYDDGSGERPGTLFLGPFEFDNSTYTETLIDDTGTSVYYEFSVDLDENYQFPADEKFWLTIRGVGFFPPQSGWGLHDDQILLHEAVFRCELLGFPDWTDTYDVFGYSADMCFQLTTKPGDVPPSAPDIQGPGGGGPGVTLCWTFHSSDENGGNVRYHINWGDGDSEVTDWYPACTPVEVCHTYKSKGTYVITAKAEDETGLLSAESSFTVVIPRSKAIYNPIFQQILERIFNAFPMLKYLLGF
jgi:hypothetical protein